MNKKIIISLIFISALLINSVYAYGENWLEGWLYRKSISITGSSGAGNNYTISLTVNYGSGSDSGSNIYLNSKCEEDFSDIRFTDDDGETLLYYWIEDYTESDTAFVYIKIFDDLDSNQLIYIYYGKSEDTETTSDIFNTFIFGDDFDDNNINDWTVSGSYSISGGELIFADVPSSSYATSPSFTQISAFKLRCLWYCDDKNSYQFGGSSSGVGSTSSNRHQAYGYTLNPDDYIYYNYGSGWYSITTMEKEEYNIVTSYVLDTNTDDCNLTVNDGSIHDIDVMKTFSNIENVYFASSSTGDALFKIDWVFISKYIYSEPYISSYGTEEETETIEEFEYTIEELLGIIMMLIVVLLTLFTVFLISQKNIKGRMN